MFGSVPYSMRVAFFAEHQGEMHRRIVVFASCVYVGAVAEEQLYCAPKSIGGGCMQRRPACWGLRRAATTLPPAVEYGCVQLSPLLLVFGVWISSILQQQAFLLPRSANLCNSSSFIFWLPPVLKHFNKYSTHSSIAQLFMFL